MAETKVLKIPRQWLGQTRRGYLTCLLNEPVDRDAKLAVLQDAHFTGWHICTIGEHGILHEVKYVPDAEVDIA